MSRVSSLTYAMLDGTLIPIDRVADDRPYYSGKHKRRGLNVQVPADPSGELVWASPTLPGAVHDLNAARSHGLIHALTAAGVTVFADKRYQGPAAPSAPYSNAITGAHPSRSGSKKSTATTPASAAKANAPSRY